MALCVNFLLIIHRHLIGSLTMKILSPSETQTCPWHRCICNPGNMPNNPFNPNTAAIIPDVCAWFFPCLHAVPVSFHLASLLIPAFTVFCFGFRSCLSFGLTYIRLINKGSGTPWINHYGISPATGPPLIESHQSHYLSSYWLSTLFVYLFLDKAVWQFVPNAFTFTKCWNVWMKNKSFALLDMCLLQHLGFISETCSSLCAPYILWPYDILLYISNPPACWASMCLWLSYPTWKRLKTGIQLMI